MPQFHADSELMQKPQEYPDDGSGDFIDCDALVGESAGFDRWRYVVDNPPDVHWPAE